MTLEPRTRRTRRGLRRLRRRERLRIAGAWLQLAWLPGLIGIAVITAAGVVRGGPSHPGMPLSWTPLFSVFVSMIAGGVIVAALGTLLRAFAAVAARRIARRPDVAGELDRQAGDPPVIGRRYGRYRITAIDPPTAAPLVPVGVRRGVRIGLAALGLLLLVMAGLAVPAVLATRGGGGDLIVTALTGFGLLALAMVRGPVGWCCDDVLERAAARGDVQVSISRWGTPWPGWRRLTIHGAGVSADDSDSDPDANAVRVMLRVDVSGWPGSAVGRHQLATVLPPALAAAIRGDGAGDGVRGGLPGDPPPPRPVPGAEVGAGAGPG